MAFCRRYNHCGQNWLKATGRVKLSACWDFAFGANAAKFYSERGAMREHNLSYVTDLPVSRRLWALVTGDRTRLWQAGEQQSAVQNLARVARSMKSQQALKYGGQVADCNLPAILLNLFIFLYEPLHMVSHQCMQCSKRQCLCFFRLIAFIHKVIFQADLALEVHGLESGAQLVI